jgi:hypothetical protein
MNKPRVPATDPSFSGDIPFPQATLEFLNGRVVTLYPAHDSHSVMGDHYFLEDRRSDGSVAVMKLTFASHGHGNDIEHYIEIEAYRGLPLLLKGDNHGFEFKGKNPSFRPTHHYALNSVTHGGDFRIELGTLNGLRLYHEPPSKSSRDLD